MIVRQAMGTFIPFAGTGMGFHRRTFNYLEKFNYDLEISRKKNLNSEDPFNLGYNPKDLEEKKEVVFSEEELTFTNDEKVKAAFNINDTRYHDDPFNSLNDYHLEGGKRVPDSVKGYTLMFLAMLIGWISFLVYTGNTDAKQNIITSNDIMEKINFAPNDASAKNNDRINLVSKQDLTNSKEIMDGIVSVGNGFSDRKYNVIYSLNNKDKFVIQESLWGNESSADKRIEVLKSTGMFKEKTIEKQMTVVNGENIFRVTISSYDNLDAARNDAAKFKKPVQ
jgi:hypothetical protein